MPTDWPPAGLPTPYYLDEACVIYHGDSRELVPLLPPGSVDLVLTDPPYGEQHTHKKHHATFALRKGEQHRQALEFAGISEAEMVALTTQWVSLAKRWVIFTCERRYINALEDAGLLVSNGVWLKPNGTPQFSGDRPAMAWEAVAICHRAGRKRWNSGGKKGIWIHNKDAKSPHPTAKPLALYRELLQDFSQPEECILDPFLGSGGTLRAAKDLGLRAIGIERDRRFCAMAAKRLAQDALPFGQRRAQCAHCQAVFQPQRRTAQYCSVRCRMAAKRARDVTLRSVVEGIEEGHSVTGAPETGAVFPKRY